MNSVKTLAAQIVRTDQIKSFGEKEEYEGTAHYMKLKTGDRVTNLVLLHLERKGNKEIYERCVYTGETLYQYVPKVKEIRPHKLAPQDFGQVAIDFYLFFLCGVKTEMAQQRYEITLQNLEDPNYYYLLFKPRTRKDKAYFEQARLALRKDNFLPAQFWFREPNGDEHTWDIPKIQKDTPIDCQEFSKPKVPTGWKMVSEKKPRRSFSSFGPSNNWVVQPLYGKSGPQALLVNLSGSRKIQAARQQGALPAHCPTMV